MHAFLSYRNGIFCGLYFGFVGLCEDCTTAYPGYYITPVCINGSAIESVLSSVKYNVSVQLSVANYMTALTAIHTTKAVKHAGTFGESSYRGQDMDIQEAILQRRESPKHNTNIEHS